MPKTTFTVSRTMSDDKWLVTQQGARLQRVPFRQGRIYGHTQIERWPNHLDLVKLIEINEQIYIFLKLFNIFMFMFSL